MANLGNLRAIWLEAFVATADARKRTAAGEEIGLEQEVVTKHIMKLEAWCGRILVDTGSFPVTLTEDGKLFLQVAKPVVEALRKGRPSDPPAASPPPPKVSGRSVML